MDLNIARQKEFLKWLRLQKKRDDPIGDLAKDYIDDSRRHKIRMRRTMTLVELTDNVSNGCEDARNTLISAWDEFCENKTFPFKDVLL